MSLMTPETTAPSPFASDPFYCLGIADAHDEHAAGDSLDTLKTRADTLLDAAYPQTGPIQPAELYRLGYAITVAGLINGHIATVNAQAEVAHTWHDRKHGRTTSSRHTARR